jgi:FkbM family methyltransferase
MNRLGRAARGSFNALVGSRPRRVRVLRGVGRGARLELDLTREKAYWLGLYEPHVQEAMRRHIRRGSVVYDVGAHIGFFSVVAARLGAVVYAFEASPANAARIRGQAVLNAVRIEVVEAAVWDGGAGVSLVAGDSDREWRTEGIGVLPTVVLDEFAGSHPAPDFVKIDVEGAEGHVLRGARMLLARTRPVIVCELHGEAARTEALEMLSGYVIQPLPDPWRVLAIPEKAVP